MTYDELSGEKQQELRSIMWKFVDAGRLMLAELYREARAEDPEEAREIFRRVRDERRKIRAGSM